MTEQRTVRIAGPAELVPAVPYLVGYRPRDALVLLALRGPRRRLAGTACVALPPRGRLDLLDEVTSRTLQAVLHGAAERVLAVVYVRRRPSSTGALPERAVATAVRRHADAAGVELEDAVAVWEDRWWSYLCRDARCCPPEGSRLPDPSTLAIVAAMVAEGVAPAPSREALAAALDPSPYGPGPELAAAVARRRAEVGTAPGPLTRARTMAALDRLLLLGAGADPPGDPSDVDDLADLLVGLADVVARDAAFCVVADSDLDASTELLRWAVRASPTDYVAPVATVLAFAAYLDGDGALANIALDRALAAEPGYPMALLLLEALSRGAHPSLLRQMVDDIRAEVLPTTAP